MNFACGLKVICKNYQNLYPHSPGPIIVCDLISIPHEWFLRRCSDLRTFSSSNVSRYTVISAYSYPDTYI
jgi:hypothetical protein